LIQNGSEKALDISQWYSIITLPTFNIKIPKFLKFYDFKYGCQYRGLGLWCLMPLFHCSSRERNIKIHQAFHKSPRFSITVTWSQLRERSHVALFLPSAVNPGHQHMKQLDFKIFDFQLWYISWKTLMHFFEVPSNHTPGTRGSNICDIE
jgi:hypothetical protein